MIETAPVKARDCPCENCVCQKPVDDKTGFEVSSEFERFNQKYDMFNRAVWDDDVRSARSQSFFESYFTDLAKFRKVEGFQHRDYALRNAAWYIADFTSDLLELSEDRKEGFPRFLYHVSRGRHAQNRRERGGQYG